MGKPETKVQKRPQQPLLAKTRKEQMVLRGRDQRPPSPNAQNTKAWTLAWTFSRRARTGHM